MRRETIELEEDKAAAVREAITGHTRTMGLVGAIGDGRIVGVVVEREAPVVEPAVGGPEATIVLTDGEPKAKRGRK